MSQSYIVVFKKDTTADQIKKYEDELTKAGGTLNQKFDTLLKGFSATIPDKLLFLWESGLTGAGSPINYIEPDQVVTTQ